MKFFAGNPLVKPLQELGEPMYLLESNPTVKRNTQADLPTEDRELGIDIVNVPRLGDADVVRLVADGE